MVEITETRHGFDDMYRRGFSINTIKAYFPVLYRSPGSAHCMIWNHNYILFVYLTNLLLVYKFENMKLF